MAKEIERTYLVVNDSYKALASESIHILQGYLNRDPYRTVRVRVTPSKAFLTVKGKTDGCQREEYEYEIPRSDGEHLLRLCEGRVLDKTRYLVPYAGNVWEVDVYHGDLEGLQVTEIELDSVDQKFELPPFAGKDVTGDPKYYNSRL